VLLAVPRQLEACPFCSAQGQTLSGEIAQADLILVGTLKNAKRDPNDFSRGSTDLDFDLVIKKHDYLAGRTSVTIPRYVPVSPNEKDTKFIVFCNLIPRPVDLPASAVASSLVLANPKTLALDAYRGDPLPAKSELGKYLKGAIEIREKDAAAKLKYFFDYLDANELLISTDAMMEFGNADYKDVRTLAEKLPADKILKWLQDPNTPQSRLGLFGLLIGHCGKPEHAAALKKLIADPDNAFSSGLDGMMAGFVMLDPKAGWEHLLSVASDRKKEFTTRFATLKVMRFFHEYRPDIIKQDQLVEGLKVLIAQEDLADLPIEDLRKWKVWDQTGFVLKFATQESHKINIVKRAILKFALSAAPHSKEAADYVAQMRQTDPDRVKLAEEILRDEEPRPTPMKP
jgi:hypothetical protein